MTKRTKQILKTAVSFLLCMTILTGCRPSEALTRLQNVANALNLSSDQMRTKEESEEQDPDNEDPIEQQDEDAQIQEEEIPTGQLFGEDYELTALQAVQAVYEELAEDNNWGKQETTMDLEDSEPEEELLTQVTENGTRQDSGDSSDESQVVTSSSDDSPTISDTSPTGDVMQELGTDDAQNSPGSSAVGTGVEGDTAAEGSTQSGGENDDSADNSSSPDTSSSGGDATIAEPDPDSPGSTDASGGSNNDDSSREYIDPEGDAQGDQVPNEDANTGTEDGTDNEGLLPDISTEEPDQPDTPNNPDTSEEPDEPEVPDTLTGGVAATGQLAILVSMLGGPDLLCATSQDYADNELAQKAFAGGDYEVLWSDDGSTPMSDANFQELLEMQPDLCLELSGENTFSESQVAQLNAAGIAYSALPDFSTTANINQTVTLLGDMLGDDAAAKAAKYIDWCANIQEDLADRVTSESMVMFIEDWDYDVETRYTIQYWDEDYNNGQGWWIDTDRSILVDTGAAIIYLYPSTTRPLTSYMQYAGVGDFCEKYISHYYGSGPSYYTPLDTRFYGTYSNGQFYWWTTANLTNRSPGINESYKFMGIRAMAQEKHGDDLLGDTIFANNDGGRMNLGYTSAFSTVITRTNEIKTALENSFSWQVNETSGTVHNGFAGYGSFIYLDISDPLLISDVYVESSIGGAYDVIVNPCGLGDWIDGSPEGILESVWLGWKVQGCYTQAQAESIIRDFYDIFYNYSLSDSEMAEILAGE